MNIKTSTQTQLCLLFSLLFSSYSFSQSGKLSVSLSSGMIDYVGDVKYTNGNPDEWGLAYGISSAYSFNSRWQLNVGLLQGTIQAADGPGRSRRNLHFKNTLTELSTTLRLNFLREPKLQVYSQAKSHFTPYLYMGVALLNQNPKAELAGEWYELQPLGTEGQYLPGSTLKPYSRIQASIPVGLGVSFRFRKILFGVEMGYRFTFTDYLDDVSTVYPDLAELYETNGDLAVQLSRRADIFSSGDKRGNPTSKDAYFFSLLRVGYIIGR